MEKIRDAIFAQAIDDYKNIVMGNIAPKPTCNIVEIERFLKSEYCKSLLVDVKITPQEILDYLHKWRQEYYDSLEKGKAKKQKKVYKSPKP